MTEEKTKQWPSLFGSLGDKYGLNEIDNEGRYYRNIISDEIPPAIHPGSGEVISSRAKWNAANRTHGMIEHKGPIENKKVDEVALARDVEQAMERAIYAADNGQSILSKEAREFFRKQDEHLGKQLGVDLTNIFKSRG